MQRFRQQIASGINDASLTETDVVTEQYTVLTPTQSHLRTPRATIDAVRVYRNASETNTLPLVSRVIVVHIRSQMKQHIERSSRRR